ncbi:MAG: hypothetical protein AAF587_02165 [Bacteroidota bacterium]
MNTIFTFCRTYCLLFLAIGMLCMGCGEEFLETPPFPEVQDTVRLDLDNWYHVTQQPREIDGFLAFPFSYLIFDKPFEGYLVNSATRIYMLDPGGDMEERITLLDTDLVPGDTLHKFTEFNYHLVIDRKADPNGDGEIFYILRRSRIRMKTHRERSIWAISPQRGILSIANYDIDPLLGQVTLDMLGESSYFRDPKLIDIIKYYDHNRVYMVDRERNVIYEFDKILGTLKSRNYEQREDLFEYRFNRTNTKELIDFRIRIDKHNIKLIAEDSCFYFSEELDLLRSGLCNE